MKAEFETYMADIAISKTMREAVIKKYALACVAANVGEFDDIFISEMKNLEGIKEYISLWCFSKTLFCKVNITKDNKITLFKLLQNIARYSFEGYNYDLNNTTVNSKLHTLVRTFDMDIPFFLKATGTNCSALLMVGKKYFITNLNT
jgi:hypothetical protein